MWNSIWVSIEPVVVTLLVTVIIAGLGVIGKYVKSYTNKATEYVVSKIGAENYAFAYKTAKDLYYALEKAYEDQSKAGTFKKAEMVTELSKLFPSLTATQINAINEAVCAEVKQLELSSGLVDKTTTETTVVNRVVDDKVVDTKTTVVATSVSTVTGATMDVATMTIAENPPDPVPLSTV